MMGRHLSFLSISSHRSSAQRNARFPPVTFPFILVLLIASFLLPLVHALPPLSQVGHIRNVQVIGRKSGRVSADSPLSIKLELDFSSESGRINPYFVQALRFQLEPNTDIIPRGASVIHLAPDGTFSSEETIDKADYKVFRGNVWLDDRSGPDSSESREDNVWHRPVGSVRAVIHRDGEAPLLDGSFDIAGQVHHIAIEGEEMIFYRDADIEPDHQDVSYHRHGNELRKRSGYVSGTCGLDMLDFNKDPDHPVRAHIRKRSDLSRLLPRQDLPGSSIPFAGNLVASIGSTKGCPSTRKVALVGVATDCTYSATFNSTDAMRRTIISQFNSASAVFERTFNLSLGLHTLVLSDRNCPGTPPSSAPWNSACSKDLALLDRLGLFSEWRAQRGSDGQSHWTLMTTCQSDAAVGIAWLGQACIFTTTKSNATDGVFRTVSGANAVVKADPQWQILAHETAHTFGAVHDCTLDLCNDVDTRAKQGCCPLSGSTCDAGEKFIMNPVTVFDATEFSACTVGNVCSGFDYNSVKTSCFTNNRDISIITGPQCGNGIVEAGEECDCGGATACGNNPCCDGATCKLKNGAQCDDLNEDCCENCKLAAQGTLCRAGNGLCDPPEVCTGKDATCPADVLLEDGSKCGNSGGLACASGQCTSRDEQCRVMMGDGFSACDQSSCTLSCTLDGSSNLLYSECYSRNQNFLDGTPCVGGGKCQNGICIGSSVGKSISEWFARNKKWAIPVIATVGGLIVLSILYCAFRRCRGRRKRKRVMPAGNLPMPILPHMLGTRPSPGYGQNPGFSSSSGPFVPKFNQPPPAYHQAGNNGGATGPRTGVAAPSDPSIGSSTLGDSADNHSGRYGGGSAAEYYAPPPGPPPGRTGPY